jgi:hypothetical protein
LSNLMCSSSILFLKSELDLCVHVHTHLPKLYRLDRLAREGEEGVRGDIISLLRTSFRRLSSIAFRVLDMVSLCDLFSLRVLSLTALTCISLVRLRASFSFRWSSFLFFNLRATVRSETEDYLRHDFLCS